MWHQRCFSWINVCKQARNTHIARKCSVTRFRKLPKFDIKTTCMSTAVTVSLCAVRCEQQTPQKFELPEPAEMSPKHIIEQSCANMAAVSLQLLQLTTAAILSASTSYKDAMAAEMLLLNKSLDFVNVQLRQEEFNDLLIEARADVQRTQKDLQELLGFLESVEKTVSSAAETTFLGGAEYSSFSLSSVLFDAQKRVAEQRVATQSMEAELRMLQQQMVLRTRVPEESTSSETNDT